MKILCLTWTPKGSRRMIEIRSMLNAEEWNCSVFYRVRLLSPIRYFIQATKTFIKLVEDRPDVVIVQNPPIFAALTCLIYGRIYPLRIIVDHHSVWSMGGSIRNPIVKSFISWIEKFCVRNADLNTTYADDWECKLNTMGAKDSLTIYDFVNEKWLKDANFSVIKRFPKDKKIVVMPCGGHVLERPDLLIEACKDLSATIVITGEKKYLQKYIARARDLKAENVVFVGFLSEKKYRGLMAGCDFAANISEQPFGIPHMVTEALASKRPVIVGGNPALVKLLGEGCPFIIPNNEVKIIRAAFLLAFENQAEYERLAAELYEKLKRQREEQVGRLLKFLSIGER